MSIARSDTPSSTAVAQVAPQSAAPAAPSPRRPWLLSPWAVFLGVAVGGYIGIFRKELVPMVAPVGEFYLDLLKMCILPILIAAISVSLGRLLKSRVGGGQLFKMIMAFVLAMVVTSAVGVVVGAVGQPGSDLDQESRATLGSIVQKNDAPDLEVYLSTEVVEKEEPTPLRKFVMSLIPDNIFNSLSSGANLQVLFFAIVFGVSMGFIRDHSADVLFELMDAIYQSFSKVVSWLMYALPFGLCGLIAYQLSQVGVQILLAMTKFVVVVAVGFGLVLVASCLVVWFRSGTSLGRVLKALEEPMLIAVATGNSLAAIPSTLTAMGEKLRFDRRRVGLVVPLGVTVCRFGPVLYFGIATMFIAQLYGVEVSLGGYLIIVLGSALAGMATAGALGVMSLAMMSLVLDPLGLPLDAVLILFMVVDPITAPLRSVTNVVTACATMATFVGIEPRWDGVERRRDKLATAEVVR